MSAKVGLLSGGQRQALTLLMATLTNPRVLLLDEHTAALDPKTAAKVLALTEQIVAERKLTTLMVTHNMNDAIRMADRCGHDGRRSVDLTSQARRRRTLPFRTCLRSSRRSPAAHWRRSHVAELGHRSSSADAARCAPSMGRTA